MQRLLLRNKQKIGKKWNFFEWELGSIRAQFPNLCHFSHFGAILFLVGASIFEKKVDKGALV